MTRVVAVFVVLILAAPAAVQADVLTLHGIEFAGPDDCCCPDHRDESAERSQIEPVCCCQLRPVHDSVVVTSVAVFDGRESVHVALVPANTRLPATIDDRAGVCRPDAARGPPVARSLFALHTSLLL